jgi:competence protein ComGC
MNRSLRAFTVVEILAIVGVIALILAMLVPALDNKPTKAPKAACMNNLRHIDAALQIWAVEHNKTTNDIPSWSDLQPYLKANQMSCPSGGKYSLAVAGQAPACSVPEHQALFLAKRRPAVFP